MSDPSDLEQRVAELETRRLIGNRLLILIGTVAGLIGAVLLFQQNALIRDQAEQRALEAEVVRRTQLLSLLYDREPCESADDECPLTASLRARTGAAKAFVRLERSRLCEGAIASCDVRPDLSRVQLSRAVLSGADLAGANLVGANLSGARLDGADLAGAYLIGADLSRADLAGADLNGANLSRADLSGARLVVAALSGADLTRANLFGADLSGARLDGAELAWANVIEADLSGANLARANLFGADLSGARLDGADLARASLIGANLSQADSLRSALLGGACYDTLTLAGPGDTLAYTEWPDGFDPQEAGVVAVAGGGFSCPSS